MAKDKTVAVFTKGPFEEVRATLSTYKGKRYAGIRIFANYDEDNEDEYQATKKGITLKLEDIANLKAAVDALAEAVNEELEEEE